MTSGLALEVRERSKATAPATMADSAPKRRTFKKFTFRGIDLEQLLDMNKNELVELFCARPRRK